MEKTLLIIAGPPATGKSYLVDILKESLSDMVVLSPDEFKINLAENIGFNDSDEKKRLEGKAWKLFYEAMDLFMRLGKRFVVIEYPFSDKQKAHLQKLSNQYDYGCVTIRLVADFEVLWERRRKRDLEHGRHLSLIMDKYHYGDTLLDRGSATDLITKSEFAEIIDQRDYNHFHLGDLFEFDVTNYDIVDYSEVIDYLKSKRIKIYNSKKYT
ncbi:MULTISPECIES: AAA family ATPase [Aerococcus]|uniref:AAA family ATPase n=1 Tax=Aerococcus TaxID=1375 RepID=UPI0022E7592C|nr:AAA family ATPase [Aerococcus urinaeequi]